MNCCETTPTTAAALKRTCSLTIELNSNMLTPSSCTASQTRTFFCGDDVTGYREKESMAKTMPQHLHFFEYLNIEQNCTHRL